MFVLCWFLASSVSQEGMPKLLGELGFSPLYSLFDLIVLVVADKGGNLVIKTGSLA